MRTNKAIEFLNFINNRLKIAGWSVFTDKSKFTACQNNDCLLLEFDDFKITEVENDNTHFVINTKLVITIKSKLISSENSTVTFLQRHDEICERLSWIKDLPDNIMFFNYDNCKIVENNNNTLIFTLVWSLGYRNNGQF